MVTPEPITLREVLGIVSGVAAFAAIVTLAWRGGSHAARVAGVEQNVAQSLRDISAKIDAFNLYVQKELEWRGAAAQRLETAESEIEKKRAQVHDDLVPKIGRALALEPRVERLENQSPRRSR